MPLTHFNKNTPLQNPMLILAALFQMTSDKYVWSFGGSSSLYRSCIVMEKYIDGFSPRRGNSICNAFDQEVIGGGHKGGEMSAFIDILVSGECVHFTRQCASSLLMRYWVRSISGFDAYPSRFVLDFCVEMVYTLNSVVKTCSLEVAGFKREDVSNAFAVV